MPSSDKLTADRVPPAENRKNLDVECLKCGAFNIPENQVCGRCGASLPLIYDEEGKVFNWREDSHYAALVGRDPQKRSRVRPEQTRWILRVGLILFALFVAFWIMRHK